MNEVKLAAAQGSALVTQEVFGHPTDFLIGTKMDGDRAVITVAAVMPALRREGALVTSFPPPRYPWPNHQAQPPKVG